MAKGGVRQWLKEMSIIGRVLNGSECVKDTANRALKLIKSVSLKPPTLSALNENKVVAVKSEREVKKPDDETLPDHLKQPGVFASRNSVVFRKNSNFEGVILPSIRRASRISLNNKESDKLVKSFKREIKALVKSNAKVRSKIDSQSTYYASRLHGSFKKSLRMNENNLSRFFYKRFNPKK